jgi:hypothetical protein
MPGRSATPDQGRRLRAPDRPTSIFVRRVLKVPKRLFQCGIASASTRAELSVSTRHWLAGLTNEWRAEVVRVTRSLGTGRVRVAVTNAAGASVAFVVARAELGIGAGTAPVALVTTAKAARGYGTLAAEPVHAVAAVLTGHSTGFALRTVGNCFDARVVLATVWAVLGRGARARPVARF